jgi:hypothetical protein
MFNAEDAEDAESNSARKHSPFGDLIEPLHCALCASAFENSLSVQLHRYGSGFEGPTWAIRLAR